MRNSVGGHGRFERTPGRLHSNLRLFVDRRLPNVVILRASIAALSISFIISTITTSIP